MNSDPTSGWQLVADFGRNGTPDLVYWNSSTGGMVVNYYSGAGGATHIV
ncbi:MAG: hypothetical protein ABSG65_27655 [Bryobacteraceae bacterium]